MKRHWGVVAVLTMLGAVSARAEVEPFSHLGSREREEYFSMRGAFSLIPALRKIVINQTANPKKVVLGDFKSGLRVIEHGGAGFGGTLPLHFPLPDGFGFGLDIKYNRGVMADRFAADWDAVKKLPKPRLPKKATDLKSWTIGDTIQYEATGSLAFKIGVNFGIPVGAYFIAEGTWLIYVERESQNLAYVKITKARLNRLGATAAIGPIGIGTERFNGADHAFSFEYNLNDPVAAMAFEDAIQGNLAPSERMANHPSEGDVRRVASSQRAISGYLGNWHFSLPFFGQGGSHGVIESITDERLHADGSRSHVLHAVSFDEKHTGGFGTQHQAWINNFSASHYDNHDANDARTQGHFGEFIWSYQKADTHAGHLRDAIKRLMRTTGLSRDVDIQVPDGKYGYIDLTLTGHFSQSAIDTLIGLAGNAGERAPEAFERIALSRVAEYFSSGEDVDGVCNQGTSPDFNSDCQSRVSENVRKQMRNTVIKLRELKSLRNRDHTRFVKEFAQLGRTLLTNRFTFGTMQDLLFRDPVQFKLSIRGTQVSSFERDVQMFVDLN